MRCPVVVDFPESTCPMTTMLMCVFSFPMLLGYAGLAGAGGAGEGGGNAAAFWGRLRGKSQERQKSPPCANPLPALRERLSSPRPTFPLDHSPGGARPRLAALLALGQSQPGYFGLPRPSLGKTPCFSASCPPPPSRRPPVPRATSWMLRRCPSSLENLPATQGCSRCLLALSKPEGISSMSWVPWEEPRVPVLPGCPHHSPAGHSSGDNRVLSKRGGQK